ncbi:MAG: YicC/YloC family endoribonuclease [Phycisphaerales bacterium JB039]
MISSMTGYGDASIERNGARYTLEIRSLNNRYLKTIIRLPDELLGLEPELDAAVRRELSRGTVTVTCSGSDATESAAYTVNARALERYIEQIREAPMATEVGAEIDLASLLGLPGVLQPPADNPERLAELRRTYLDLLKKACAGLRQMRQTEGAGLAGELRDLCVGIQRKLEEIGARAPEVSAEYEKRLRARIERLVADMALTAEPADILREVAAYAERTDIHEEISRLGAHVQQFLESLDSKGAEPVGRKLDFVAQEMLREANTIASKSPDADISRATIEIKSAIDRIKEQVQNVE